MFRSAVIGCGVISHIHIPVLQDMENVTLAAVCDIDPAKKPDLSPDHPVPFYTDYQTLYEEVRPDVVHICLPHYLHYPVSRFFAERGVHVFCEKPAALNSAQLEEFISLEEAHPELKIGICFQNRLNDTTIRLKELLDSGEYGPVISLGAAGGEKDPVDEAIELVLYCMKTQIFLDGNKRASVIFANHRLISRGGGLLVVPEGEVAAFKELLIRHYEGTGSDECAAFLKERCWRTF